MAWCPFREHSMPGAWACFAVVGGQQSVHEEPQLLLQKVWVSQNIRQFCVTKQIGAERMELMSSPATSPLPVWKSLKFSGVGSWSASPRMYICQLIVYPVLRGEESRSRRRSCVTSSPCAFPIFSLFWLKQNIKRCGNGKGLGDEGFSLSCECRFPLPVLPNFSQIPSTSISSSSAHWNTVVPWRSCKRPTLFKHQLLLNTKAVPQPFQCCSHLFCYPRTSSIQIRRV